MPGPPPRSFLTSQKLWEHMQFLVERGSMCLRRDDHLIFHGCVPGGRGRAVPADDGGRRARHGPGAVRRPRAAWSSAASTGRHAATRRTSTCCWYLWCGPRSPLFGKDRIATLESDLVADDGDPRTRRRTPTSS